MFYYYPIYCRTKIRKNKSSGFSWVEGELEVGYALNDMEESFVNPVEDLMLQTAGLVLLPALMKNLKVDKIITIDPVTMGEKVIYVRGDL